MHAKAQMQFYNGIVIYQPIVAEWFKAAGVQGRNADGN